MREVMNLQNEAKILGWFLVQKFKKELVEQGHVLDGNLRDSLEMGVEMRVGGFVLSFMGLAYGMKLNDGVKSGDIPDEGSMRYVDMLRELAIYASKRFGVYGGLSFKIGKNIINKWREDGMPTRNSYRFSKNGRRVGWIDYVLENQKEDIDRLVNDVMGVALIDLIKNDLMNFDKN